MNLPPETRERIERIAEHHSKEYRQPNWRQLVKDDIIAALTQLAEEEQREREWRPIATAPKDVPIVGLKGQMAYRTEWTKFHDKWPHEEGGPTYRYEWTMATRDEKIPWKPTHWMPIPKSPTP